VAYPSSKKKEKYNQFISHSHQRFDNLLDIFFFKLKERNRNSHYCSCCDGAFIKQVTFSTALTSFTRCLIGRKM
jgi:hypothetical protein